MYCTQKLEGKITTKWLHIKDKNCVTQNDAHCCCFLTAVGNMYGQTLTGEPSPYSFCQEAHIYSTYMMCDAGRTEKTSTNFHVMTMLSLSDPLKLMLIVMSWGLAENRSFTSQFFWPSKTLLKLLTSRAWEKHTKSDATSQQPQPVSIVFSFHFVVLLITCNNIETFHLDLCSHCLSSSPFTS